MAECTSLTYLYLKDNQLTEVPRVVSPFVYELHHPALVDLVKDLQVTKTPGFGTKSKPIDSTTRGSKGLESTSSFVCHEQQSGKVAAFNWVS